MRTSCHTSRANGICYQLELFVDRQGDHAMRIQKVDSLSGPCCVLERWPRFTVFTLLWFYCGCKHKAESEKASPAAESPLNWGMFSN